MSGGRAAAALFESSVAVLLPNYSPVTAPKSLCPVSKRTATMSSSSCLPNASAVDAASSSSASAAVDFLTLCHRLKATKRAGWVRRGVSDPESVADHMYRMSVMALIAPDVPGADRDRLVKMAIVHDIAEAIVGDITPADRVPKEEKSTREREAIDHMCNLLGGGSRAKEIEELWTEYEENSSLEAKVVKDFDKENFRQTWVKRGHWRLHRDEEKCSNTLAASPPPAPNMRSFGLLASQLRQAVSAAFQSFSRYLPAFTSPFAESICAARADL